MLYVVAFLVSSLGFAALWVRTPALWVINLPEPAWIYLMDLFDAHCCESAADVELLVAIVFGAIFTSLIAFTIHIVKKRLLPKDAGPIPNKDVL